MHQTMIHEGLLNGPLLLHEDGLKRYANDVQVCVRTEHNA